MPADPAAAPVDSSQLRLEFPAAPAAVRIALDRFLAALPVADLPPNLRANAEIVLAEVLNNIVEHAYAGGGGSIELAIRADATGLHCLVCDHGNAMPGGFAPYGDLPDSLGEDLPEGGFGWHLIRSLARDICYRRDMGVNRLSFRLPTEQSGNMC